MKFRIRCGTIAIFGLLLTTTLMAQERVFLASDRLTLGTDVYRSASVRMGDVDNDGDLDVVVANGRHWPEQNFLFLNTGRAKFSIMRPLGSDRRTSYACEFADLDGDGDLDIATGNDMASGRILHNDGAGMFSEHAEFGEVSSLRSLTLADIDSDGDIDILSTCRGRANRIYLNDGAANFTSGPTFGRQDDSTIDVAVADINADGHKDLLMANRDRHSDDATQVVVNGWPWIVSYDLDSGEERWRLEGGGDNPVPTPFEANGWIYITNAHGAKSPIYVVRPDSQGNLSADESNASKDAVVWSTDRGGSYMSTPIVYGDYLYLGNSNGVVRCFHATSGEKVYEERLGKQAGIIASLVAADGKIYCASENGNVYVLPAGAEFKILAINPMSEPVLATPAISERVLYIRTTRRLVAIQ